MFREDLVLRSNRFIHLENRIAELNTHLVASGWTEDERINLLPAFDKYRKRGIADTLNVLREQSKNQPTPQQRAEIDIFDLAELKIRIAENK